MDSNSGEDNSRTRYNTWPQQGDDEVDDDVMSTLQLDENDEKTWPQTVSVNLLEALDTELAILLAQNNSAPAASTPEASAAKGKGPGKAGKKKAGKDDEEEKKPRNAWGGHTYAQLIKMAIESPPERRMKVAQIYQWFEQHHELFRSLGPHDKPDWRNSVRHNLSLRFKLVREENAKLSVPGWWEMYAEGEAPQASRRRALSLPHGIPDKDQAVSKAKVARTERDDLPAGGNGHSEEERREKTQQRSGPPRCIGRKTAERRPQPGQKAVVATGFTPPFTEASVVSGAAASPAVGSQRDTSGTWSASAIVVGAAISSAPVQGDVNLLARSAPVAAPCRRDHLGQTTLLLDDAVGYLHMQQRQHLQQHLGEQHYRKQQEQHLPYQQRKQIQYLQQQQQQRQHVQQQGFSFFAQAPAAPRSSMPQQRRLPAILPAILQENSAERRRWQQHQLQRPQQQRQQQKQQQQRYELSNAATAQASPGPVRRAQQKCAALAIASSSPTPRRSPSASYTPTADLQQCGAPHSLLSLTMPLASSSVQPLASSSMHPLACSSVQPMASSSMHPLACSSVQPMACSSVQPLASSSVQPLACSSMQPLASSSVQPLACSSVQPMACSSVHPLVPPQGSTSASAPVGMMLQPGSQLPVNMSALYCNPSSSTLIVGQQRRSSLATPYSPTSPSSTYTWSPQSQPRSPSSPATPTSPCLQRYSAPFPSLPSARSAAGVARDSWPSSSSSMVAPYYLYEQQQLSAGSSLALYSSSSSTTSYVMPVVPQQQQAYRAGSTAMPPRVQQQQQPCLPTYHQQQQQQPPCVPAYHHYQQQQQQQQAYAVSSQHTLPSSPQAPYAAPEAQSSLHGDSSFHQLQAILQQDVAVQLDIAELSSNIEIDNDVLWDLMAVLAEDMPGLEFDETSPRRVAQSQKASFLDKDAKDRSRSAGS